MKWNVNEIKRVINELRSDDTINDDEAFAAVEFKLMDEDGLEDYLVNELKIQDPVGYLACQI